MLSFTFNLRFLLYVLTIKIIKIHATRGREEREEKGPLATSEDEEVKRLPLDSNDIHEREWIAMTMSYWESISPALLKIY